MIVFFCFLNVKGKKNLCVKNCVVSEDKNLFLDYVK